MFAIQRNERVQDAVVDVARGPNLEFKSYSTLWHDGRHFCKDIIDKAMKTCDFEVACRYTNANGETYDHIGIIEDIVVITFRITPPTILLKAN